MKLKKCYVYSFGKLKNFEYDFKQGLNTIIQDNGWGKSTFATFIKSMFYGLNDKKKNVSDNERIKYRPWNSTEKFGGYVIFEWKAQEFKIERFFGAKESEDTINLSDVATGKSFSNTSDLGKRIFQIDEEGFLSSTYFSQKEIEAKSNSSITAKFNSVHEVQDPELFDKALKKIEERAKEYKYRGGKGKLADIKEEIRELERRTENAKMSKLALEKLDAERKELLDEQSKLKIVAEKLSDELVVSGKAEAIVIKQNEYNKIKQEKTNLNLRLQENVARLGLLNANPEELKKVKSDIDELNKTSIAIQNVESDLAMLEKDFKPKKSLSLGQALVGICPLAVLAIISLVFSWFIVFGVSVVVAIVLFVLTLGNKNGTQALISSKKSQLGELKNILNEKKTILDRFFKDAQINLSNGYEIAFESLMSIIKESNELLESVKKVNDKLVELEKDKDLFLQPNNSLKSAEEIRELIRDNSIKLSVLSQKLAENASVIRRHEEIIDETVFLREKKEQLEQVLDEYNSEYEILTLTADFLKKADENLKVKYKKPLQTSLDRYVFKTFGDNVSVNIDIDLNVKAVGEGAERDIEYFSKGNQNLFEICKRFALIDVLFTVEKPFIILDDPFYNLDGEKLNATKKLISELANDYQIIYLVCHESRLV